MTLKKRFFLYWILLLTAIPAQGDLRFLLPPVSSPAIMYAAFHPMAEYLGKIAGSPVHLTFSPSLRAFYLEAEKVRPQIVLFCPIAYLRVTHQKSYIPLAGLNPPPGGNKSLIVVRKDSPVRNILQLRGKRFVIGNPACAASALVPLSLLREIGIRTTEFRDLHQSGSDINALMDVSARFYDATAVAANIAAPYIQAGDLRAIARMDVGPGDLIAASGKVRMPVRQKIRQALLDMADQDPAALKALSMLATGFHPLVPGTYEPLRALYADFYGMDLPPRHRGKFLRLGIPPAYSPLNAARIFHPLQEILSSLMGSPVEISVPRDESAYLRGILNGDYSFALLSPLMDRAVGKHMRELASLLPAPGSRGLAIVSLAGHRRNSSPGAPIQVAYSSPYCSAGSIMRREIRHLADGHPLVWEPTRSESAVFSALAAGKADWGVVRAPTIEALARETPDTWKTRGVGGPAPEWILAGTRKLPQARISELHMALLSLPQNALAGSGFWKIQDSPP